MWIEKAAVEAALSRGRVLARQIKIEIRKKRSEQFVDKRRRQTFTPPLRKDGSEDLKRSEPCFLPDRAHV
jgi:hypothetical protein